jgi:hypothetical protein
MNKDKIVFARQAFLNLPGHNSTAAIVASITQGELNEHEDNQTVDVELHISDCNRTISFDFDLYNKAERENALYKVETIISVLTEFRDEIKKASKHQTKFELKYKKRRLKELEELEEAGQRGLREDEKRSLKELREQFKKVVQTKK